MSFYLMGPPREITHACSNELLDRYGIPIESPEYYPPARGLLLPDRQVWRPKMQPLTRSCRIWIDNTLHGGGLADNRSVQLGDVISLLNHTFTQDATWRLTVYERATSLPSDWVAAATVNPAAGTFTRQSDQIILHAGFRGAVYVSQGIPVGLPVVSRVRATENFPFRAYSQTLWLNGDAWLYTMSEDYVRTDCYATSDYNIGLKSYESFVQVYQSPWEPMTGPLGVDSDVTPGGVLPDSMLHDKRSSFIRMPGQETELTADLVMIELDWAGGAVQEAQWLRASRGLGPTWVSERRSSWLDTSNRTRSHNGDPGKLIGRRRRRLDLTMQALSDAERTTVEALLDVMDGSGQNPLVLWRQAAGHRSYNSNGPWTVRNITDRQGRYDDNELKIQLQRWE